MTLTKKIRFQHFLFNGIFASYALASGFNLFEVTATYIGEIFIIFIFNFIHIFLAQKFVPQNGHYQSNGRNKSYKRNRLNTSLMFLGFFVAQFILMLFSVTFFGFLEGYDSFNPNHIYIGLAFFFVDFVLLFFAKVTTNTEKVYYADKEFMVMAFKLFGIMAPVILSMGIMMFKMFFISNPEATSSETLLILFVIFKTLMALWLKEELKE